MPKKGLTFCFLIFLLAGVLVPVFGAELSPYHNSVHEEKSFFSLDAFVPASGSALNERSDSGRLWRVCVSLFVLSVFLLKVKPFCALWFQGSVSQKIKFDRKLILSLLTGGRAPPAR